jgi:hypothetical protein
MGGTVYNVAVFVVIAIAIYYFYKWLSGNSSNENTESIIYNPPYAGMVANASNPNVYTLSTNPDLPSIYGGGELSISTWIYVSKWTNTVNHNKRFLTLSNDSTGAILVLYLGQNTPKLGVRVSTSDLTLNSTELNKIVGVSVNAAGASSSSAPIGIYGDASTEKCDIESLDLQRWVNITVVLDGKVADVYIDGKMSRSCVLSGPFKATEGNPATRVTLGGNYGFNGLIGQTRLANFAYSPDNIYAIYQNGPNDTSIFTKIKGYFDPKQYSFSLTVNGQNIASASS